MGEEKRMVLITPMLTPADFTHSPRKFTTPTKNSPLLKTHDSPVPLLSETFTVYTPLEMLTFSQLFFTTLRSTSRRSLKPMRTSPCTLSSTEDLVHRPRTSNTPLKLVLSK